MPVPVIFYEKRDRANSSVEKRLKKAGAADGCLPLRLFSLRWRIGNLLRGSPVYSGTSSDLWELSNIEDHEFMLEIAG